VGGKEWRRGTRTFQMKLADQIDDYSSFMKNDYSTLKNTGTFQRALKDVKNITLAFVLELFNLN
jgi:hypothetical protein